MIISVKEALKNQGERFELDVEASLAPMEYMGKIRFPVPAKVTGYYIAEGDAVRFTGTVSVSCVFECDRCLREFSKDLLFDFSESYSHHAEEEQFTILPNDTIDFQPLLMDTVIAGLPIERLCREDCKGLCPHCGIDKNFSSCSCEAEEEENPFAVLRGLVD